MSKLTDTYFIEKVKEQEKIIKNQGEDIKSLKQDISLHEQDLKSIADALNYIFSLMKFREFNGSKIVELEVWAHNGGFEQLVDIITHYYKENPWEPEETE